MLCTNYTECSLRKGQCKQSQSRKLNFKLCDKTVDLQSLEFIALENKAMMHVKEPRKHVEEIDYLLTSSKTIKITRVLCYSHTNVCSPSVDAPHKQLTV